MNNFAFIDNQNLYCAMKEINRDFDYKRFRIYIKDKFSINKAYIFIWYRVWNESLYTKFQDMWYIIIFKPTLETKNWIIKWNCDAELVLHTMINFNEFEKAIIVSWDWDFHCLVEYLQDNWKLLKVLIPRSDRYSALLRKFKDSLFYINHPGIKNKLTKLQ